jgi:hypothetical protein
MGRKRANEWMRREIGRKWKREGRRRSAMFFFFFFMFFPTIFTWPTAAFLMTKWVDE